MELAKERFVNQRETVFSRFESNQLWTRDKTKRSRRLDDRTPNHHVVDKPSKQS
jgi:hypothetical protein